MDIFGIIFCMYSVAVILGSPLIGHLLGKFKKRNLVRLGVFSYVLSMLMIGLSTYVENTKGFLALCFVARLIQGFSSASIQTTSFSIFGVLYKDNLE